MLCVSIVGVGTRGKVRPRDVCVRMGVVGTGRGSVMRGRWVDVLVLGAWWRVVCLWWGMWWGVYISWWVVVVMC